MIYLGQTICSECGKVRNQHVKHKACAKARQQKFEQANRERVPQWVKAGTMPRLRGGQ